MINLRFESTSFPEDTFKVLEFHGEEEISRLFRFEMRLVSRDPDIDFKSVLEGNAFLAITTQDHTRYVHGMLSEFEQGGEWQNGLYEYRAVLVPRLWMLTQSLQNQIFQDRTVPDIIESELGEFSNKGEHPLVLAGLNTADYEIYMESSYAQREYVVQYKESDFNFLSRLMEHEGIHYYFEHDETREKLVISDAMATEEIAGDSHTEFQTEEAAARFDSNVVFRLSRSQKQVPASVLVTDYNYRRPDLPMQATGDVTVEGIGGIGFVNEFGAHFKEAEEGQKLATIRAEEFRCRQNIYSGEGNIAAFCCGGLYSLEQHFRKDYNQSYMITRVKHRASQEIESWNNVGSTNYRNQFDCIPSGLPYRPQRLTPKPKLYGIMNGTIDSEQDLGRADLDEFGRYKVLMPFDISGAGAGMGSRRIRMAQPYGGGGTGMSFPLLKGTEVIWTCIDGDIDRPIITGAVPNPLNPSVTTTENNTSNVIKTTSGITMGFLDGSGGGASQSAAGGGGSLREQKQYQHVLGHEVGDSGTGSVGSRYAQATMGAGLTGDLAQQQHYNTYDQSNMGVDEVLAADGTVTTEAIADDNSFVIDVPNETARSYFRMGAKVPSTPALTVGGDTSDEYGAGILSYTEGDYTSVVKGKISNITGDSWAETNLGFKFSYGLSNTYSYSIGQSFTASAGLFGSSKLGLSVGTNVGVAVSLQYATAYTFGLGTSYTYVKNGTKKLAKTITNEVDQIFQVTVDPGNEPAEKFIEQTVQPLAAGLAIGSATATLGIGALGLIGKNLNDAEHSKNTTLAANIAAGTHAGATYIAGAALALKARQYQKAQRSDSGKPAAKFRIVGNEALLEVGEKALPEPKKYKEDGDKTIFLSARKADSDVKDNVMMRLKKGGSGDDGNRIDLRCGKEEDEKGSVIRLNNELIKLKVGKCSIEMKTDSIVFKVDDESLTLDKKGLALAKKDLKVVAGEVTIGKKLTVEESILAENITAKDEVKSKRGTLG